MGFEHGREVCAVHARAMTAHLILAHPLSYSSQAKQSPGFDRARNSRSAREEVGRICQQSPGIQIACGVRLLASGWNCYQRTNDINLIQYPGITDEGALTHWSLSMSARWRLENSLLLSRDFAQVHRCQQLLISSCFCAAEDTFFNLLCDEPGRQSQAWHRHVAALHRALQ